MSGTSLDGMDIAHCAFEYRDGRWHYNILAAETFDYSDHWREKLRAAPGLDAQTTDFKEALIFAFLGLLCKQRKVNCLASVTGAKQDSTGGSIHYFTG